MAGDVIYLEKKECGLPFYVRGIGYRRAQGKLVSTEGQQVAKWFFCTTGSGYLTIQEKDHLMTPGMSFCIQAHNSHVLTPVEVPWGGFFLSFMGEGSENLLRQLMTEDFYCLDVKMTEEMTSLFDEMYLYSLHQDSNSQYLLSAKLYSFLIAWHLSLKTIDAKSKSQNRLLTERLMRLMEQNYHTDLTMQEMAKELYISKQYLCRVFKSETGMRPFEALLKIRCQKAAALLLEEEETPILEIATRCGFHSVSYFCNVFKKQEQVSPVRYRMLYRQ